MVVLAASLECSKPQRLNARIRATTPRRAGDRPRRHAKASTLLADAAAARRSGMFHGGGGPGIMTRGLRGRVEGLGGFGVGEGWVGWEGGWERVPRVVGGKVLGIGLRRLGCVCVRAEFGDG